MPDRVPREGFLSEHIQLGNYRLLRHIGQGGFADVYLGEQIHINIYAAIKLLKTQLEEANFAKFRQEARIIGSLTHPNIVALYDFGIDPVSATPYLIMQYAPGGSLRKRHPLHSRLAPELVLTYGEQIAAALDYAHREQIIHRDVKPENMLIGQHGDILLSDFGIATLVDSATNEATPTIAGTYAYMAPEQHRGHSLPASDQYALAVVFYEWLCGERPFKGTPLQVATQHVQVKPPPLRFYNPNIPPALEEVVLKALAKNPEQRFPGVGAFLAAFRQIIKPAQPSMPLWHTWPVYDKSSEQLGSERPEHPQRPASQPDPAARPPLDHREVAPAVPAESPDAKTPSRRLILAGGLAALGTLAGGLIWWTNSHASNNANTRANSHSPGADSRKTTIRSNIPTVSVQAKQGQQLFVYNGHTQNVLAVAWSPKEDLIASGSLDKTVQVWHALTGSIIYSYGRHTKQVNTVSWSPDGTYIASGSNDSEIHIINASAGDLVRFYSGHQDAVSFVSWSPNGMYIASASFDKTVQVWNASTGDLITRYGGHTNVVSSVSWSSDGNFIASASSDTTVHVWKALTGQFLFKYTKHTDFVSSVVWSHDQQQVVSGSDDKTVQIWDTFDGGNSYIYQNHQGAVFTVALSPDGTLVASGSSDRTIHIWKFSNAQKIFIYSKHTGAVRSVAWSSDGTHIASGGDDRSVQVWQAV